MSEVCVLDDGRRVRFSLKKREGRDPYYLASFRGPDGRRKELSTKEPNKKRATDAAVAIVREAYRPLIESPKNPPWDGAIESMVEQMHADNLRPSTIDQYVLVIKALRRACPTTHGPAEITPLMASQFKASRRKAGRWGRPISVRTLKGNLDNLNIVYNKWWIGECKLLDRNPFGEVSLPKLDKSRPRVLLPTEVASFLGWLSQRWGGWRLPVLLLETKRLVGCRILELSSASTSELREGRLYFPADETKGRKERGVKLPSDVYQELEAIAGPRYLWESFPIELGRVYHDRGWKRAGRVEPEFRPVRLKKWLQREKRAYLKQNPSVKRFKLHNLRGTAMTKAKEAGISYEDAAIAFGCNPDTMRKHYVALDETDISDRVMDAIQGGSATKPGEVTGTNDPIEGLTTVGRPSTKGDTSGESKSGEI